jgi:hypothetical protein
MHDLALRASPVLASVLAAVYGAAALGLLLGVRPHGVGAALAGLAVALGVRDVRRHALRVARASTVRLHGGADGAWHVEVRDGRALGPFTLDAARSLCHPWLVVLALRGDRRRRFEPICADAAPPEALRALRVMLRAAG